MGDNTWDLIHGGPNTWGTFALLSSSADRVAVSSTSSSYKQGIVSKLWIRVQVHIFQINLRSGSYKRSSLRDEEDGCAIFKPCPQYLAVPRGNLLIRHLSNSTTIPIIYHLPYPHHLFLSLSYTPIIYPYHISLSSMPIIYAYHLSLSLSLSLSSIYLHNLHNLALCSRPMLLRI